MLSQLIKPPILMESVMMSPSCPPFGLCCCLCSITRRICFLEARPTDKGMSRLANTKHLLTWKTDLLMHGGGYWPIILSDYRMSWDSPPRTGTAEYCSFGMHARTIFALMDTRTRTLNPTLIPVNYRVCTVLGPFGRLISTEWYNGFHYIECYLHAIMLSH